MTDELLRKDRANARIKAEMAEGKCAHKGPKRIEGNLIWCLRCKRLAGFLRKPGK